MLEPLSSELTEQQNISILYAILDRIYFSGLSDAAPTQKQVDLDTLLPTQKGLNSLAFCGTIHTAMVPQLLRHGLKDSKLSCIGHSTINVRGLDSIVSSIGPESCNACGYRFTRASLNSLIT